MSQSQFDRREFLVAGAAAAGSLACPSFLRAARAVPPTLETSWLVCPESSTWPDLSATAVAAMLNKPKSFVSVFPADATIAGAALLTLHGAAAPTTLKSCDRVEVHILYPSPTAPTPRRFLAAVIRPGGDPASPLACRLPLDNAGRVGVVLKTYSTDNQPPVEYAASLLARRGLYALTLGEPSRAAGDFRFEAGSIRADSPAFVVLSLDAAEAPAASDAKK